MKQRIRVVGLVKRDGETLVMKRDNGRMDAPIEWELPTGKINFGEQPEEAMARIFYDQAGVHVKDVKLVDVVTFMALNGSSQLANLYIIYEINIGFDEKIIPGERYTAYKFLKDSDNLRLDEASLAVLAIREGRNRGEKSSYRGVANGATVYVDGASRGNPGPSGIGYYIIDTDGHVLKRGGEFIGFASSRVAEYFALKKGCEEAIALGLKSVRFISDSLMMVNQMNGIYKIKNADLVPIYQDIQKLLENFEACAFVHVKREQNVEADHQAGMAIDAHFSN